MKIRTSTSPPVWRLVGDHQPTGLAAGRLSTCPRKGPPLQLVNFNQPTWMAAGWFLWSREDCLGLLTGAPGFVNINTSTEIESWRSGE
jgi:hypothetical protein